MTSELEDFCVEPGPLKEISANFLHLLMDHGLKIDCNLIFFFKNAIAEKLERIIKREDQSEFFESDSTNNTKYDFCLRVLSEGRMDLLKVMEAHGISLAILNRHVDYDLTTV